MKSRKLKGNSTISVKSNSSKKLGLLTNKKRKIISCRMRLEVIHAWNELTKHRSKVSDISLGKIDVIESLILKAYSKEVKK